MKNPEPSDQAENQIKQLLDRWAQAFEKRDIDGIMSLYLPGNELVAYDIVPPLAYRGSAAYRRDYEEFFKQYKGPVHVEFRDLRIVAGSDVAFAYGLERMTGTLVDGKPSELWIRVTEGYRMVNGRWYAVHDHISVPVDFASGKAALDLKP
jgi:ketosteroid isomerase-like protein